MSAVRRRSRAAGRPGWVAALGWLGLLLVSLSVVTWRQTRGLAAERAVRELETDRALAEAERIELTRRIEELRSRARIVRVAGERLGMHLPQDHEIVFLPVAGTLPADSSAEEGR